MSKNYNKIFSSDGSKTTKAAGVKYGQALQVDILKPGDGEEEPLDIPERDEDVTSNIEATPIISGRDGEVVDRVFPERHVTGCSFLNIRAEGNINAEILGMLLRGTTVTVLVNDGEWSKIRTIGSHKEVYAMSKFLSY